LVAQALLGLAVCVIALFAGTWLVLVTLLMMVGHEAEAPKRESVEDSLEQLLGAP
jgi:hypothetical protein